MTLNQILEEAGASGINFTVETIGVEKDFPKKSGGTYKSCTVELMVPSTRTVWETRLFKSQITEMGLTVGSTLNGKSGSHSGSKYPVWSPVQTGESTLTTEQPNNYSQVQAERRVTEAIEKENSNKEEVVIGMITHGFMRSAITSGKTPMEAVAVAREAYECHKDLVQELIKAKDLPF